MTLPPKDPEDSTKDLADSIWHKQLEVEMKRHAFDYVAWTHTRYVSELDHGTYIHVDVEVDVAPSAIVLVRKGEALLISQNPSAYE